jgi:hypothetical protein
VRLIGNARDLYRLRFELDDRSIDIVFRCLDRQPTGRSSLYCNVALMDGSAVMGGANGGGLDHAVLRRGRDKI